MAPIFLSSAAYVTCTQWARWLRRRPPDLGRERSQQAWASRGLTVAKGRWSSPPHTHKRSLSEHAYAVWICLIIDLSLRQSQSQFRTNTNWSRSSLLIFQLRKPLIIALFYCSLSLQTVKKYCWARSVVYFYSKAMLCGRANLGVKPNACAAACT
jgi:hypothetical protein